MQGKFVDGIRSVGTVLVREVADHPAMTDPAVRRYFSSKVNWLFLMVALIMYAVAWPTLTLTHDLPAYWLPIVSAFAALPIALSWSAPSVGWAVSVLSAYLVALLVPVDPGWNWEIQVVHIIELLVLTFFVFARGPLRSLPLVWICTVVIFVLVAPAEARVGWAVGLTFLAVVTALAHVIVTEKLYDEAFSPNRARWSWRNGPASPGICTMWSPTGCRWWW